MATVCHVLLSVSRRLCTFMLRTVQQYAVHFVFRTGSLSQAYEKILSNIPSDPCVTEEEFSLANKTTTLAVCPNPDCHFTLHPTFQAGSPVAIYPDMGSNHRDFPGGKKCSTPLLKPRRVNDRTVYLPIKPFVASSIKDWFSGLLSRSGLEEKMDNAWASCKAGPTPPKDMKDIFDAEVLRNFKMA